MKTVEQLNQQIADLKARPKTNFVQERIESLLRQHAQILSADKKDVRRLRSRATFAIGSTVLQAAEDPKEQALADWLLDRVSQLPAKDRDLVRAAFPGIFSESSSTPDAPLPPQAAAHLTKETKNG